MLLRWSIVFFILTAVTGVLGFTDVVQSSITIFRILFIVFLTLFVMSIIGSAIRGFRWKRP